jgi:hypothetical protein
MAVELYHFWSSVCSVRCRMALEEKGIEWTSRYIDLFKFDQMEPGYLVINPDGLVPTLVHNGAPVRESMYGGGLSSRHTKFRLFSSGISALRAPLSIATCNGSARDLIGLMFP